MRHAMIMAGGSGTRLWPLSRRCRPKHFLKLFAGKSLLRVSFDRLAGFVPLENLSVVTSAEHVDLVADELPELPRSHLIGEPAIRDTANAIGLAANILRRRDPQGVLGVFTADHIIKPIEQFRSALDRAYRAAEEHSDALVTIGIRPQSPHTGYGYIRRGRQLSEGVYDVGEFREKPELDVARQYIESGDYYWNSGMFVWRLDTFLNQFQRHLPENHELLLRITAAVQPSEQDRLIAEIYPALPKISIDYGVMERAERVVVCEMDCDWLDVGSWTALSDVLGTDAAGEVRGHPNVVALDTRNNIYVGEDNHLLAAVGVQDVVIVHSSTATLVCHRKDVQKIKALVALLDESYH